jgi:PKD repeat protein
MSVAILVYIAAYYIYKWRFFALVEKPSKIATQGIGAYFLTWIVSLGLFVTILHPIAVFTYSPTSPIAGTTVIFNAAGSYSSIGYITSYEWNFGDGNVTAVTSPVVTHVYVAPGNYTVNLRVTNNFGFSISVSKIVEVKVPW